uniref:Uncharacterized protein n=1 Tax=Triticum urartu TaxID=4572 RepID=A0A8R7PUY7_TRIUA
THFTLGNKVSLTRVKKNDVYAHNKRSEVKRAVKNKYIFCGIFKIHTSCWQ